MGFSHKKPTSTLLRTRVLTATVNRISDGKGMYSKAKVCIPRSPTPYKRALTVAAPTGAAPVRLSGSTPDLGDAAHETVLEQIVEIVKSDLFRDRNAGVVCKFGSEQLFW